ncbi:hypothetical protein EYE40_02360 [Glaciihabitans arcticus]|uniref:Uncharacterized protein n=1 Tax=Glaciihabitans arcticus TaxID=2668039 RepID=A0A4Q9GVW6_9MICO|nr:hypothetical protein [Glaciihabitans arcticus]TBN56330.1 hypothetical protein EYE40_02360 [Glaciihabitans arcticus]
MSLPPEYPPPAAPSAFPPPEPVAEPVAPVTPKRRRWLAPVIAGGTVFLLLIVGAVVAVVQRENIRDLFTVWNYEPSKTIVGYIDRSDMSDRGEFLFKASEPVIAGPTEFNDTCGALEEGTGVLGCYLPTTRGILLFDVTDERLDGVEEVVASHEMLHAAWHRMSRGDRTALEPLLEAEAEKREDDEAFTARMELYERVEPGARLNELHSIVGTELEDISPALEKHYAEYFTDRSIVVDLHVTSEAVLKDIEERTTALVEQLDTLYDEIEADYESYNTGYDKLNKAVAGFNAKNNAYGFTNQREFDAERNALILREIKLEKLFTSIQKRSKVYDGLIADLKELNSQSEALNKELNIVPRESDF